MAKNVELNYYNGSNYEIMYPSTLNSLVADSLKMKTLTYVGTGQRINSSETTAQVIFNVSYSSSQLNLSKSFCCVFRGFSAGFDIYSTFMVNNSFMGIGADYSRFYGEWRTSGTSGQWIDSIDMAAISSSTLSIYITTLEKVNSTQTYPNHAIDMMNLFNKSLALLILFCLELWNNNQQQ